MFPNADDTASLVATQYRTVLKTALAVLGRSADAEDAAQDVVLKILQKNPALPERIDPWLYRVTVNTCKDRFRGSRPTVQLHAFVPDPSPSPERLLQRQEQTQLINAALRSLTSRERTVIVLRYLEGLSVGETATLLKTNALTVRSRAHAGRAKLVTYLRSDRKQRNRTTETSIKIWTAATE